MQAIDRPRASSKAKQTRKRSIPISPPRFSRRQQMSTHCVPFKPTTYLALTFSGIGLFRLSCYLLCCCRCRRRRLLIFLRLRHSIFSFLVCDILARHLSGLFISLVLCIIIIGCNTMWNESWNIMNLVHARSCTFLSSSGRSHSI
jgi:hypothetical protein